MEITPVVSNFIKHKQIAFVKRREKEQRGQMINEQQQKPIAPKVQRCEISKYCSYHHESWLQSQRQFQPSVPVDGKNPPVAPEMASSCGSMF